MNKSKAYVLSVIVFIASVVYLLFYCIGNFTRINETTEDNNNTITPQFVNTEETVISDACVTGTTAPETSKGTSVVTEE